MSSPKIIKMPIPDELKPYLNEKGVLEIVMREKNQKYKSFVNLMFEQVSESEGKKEALNQIAKLLGKNAKIGAEGLKQLKQLESLVALGNLNLLMSGANLFATSAGFALIYAKLEQLGEEIDQKLSEIQENIKDAQDTQIGHQFNKVVSEHNDMLDCKRRKKPYTDTKLRELIDEENNVLKLLLANLEKDISNNNRQLIRSIVSLASMMTVAIKDFDEEYYFNNKDVVSDGKYWHMSHDNWMKTYGDLSSKEFAKILQDHALFELKYGTRETDVFYENLLENVGTMEQGVRDNMTLIQNVDNRDAINEIRKFINQEVIGEIRSTVEDVSDGMENPVLKKACQAVAQVRN